MDSTNNDISENNQLQNKLDAIIKENDKLKINIQKLQDLMSSEICKYFDKVLSLKKTTEHFYFENIRDCYQALLEYYGCSDPIESAIDYEDYYSDIFG